MTEGSGSNSPGGRRWDLGQEIPCEVRVDGQMHTGTAQLESTEILFRGEHRLKLPLSGITKVSERDGWLLVRTKEHLAEFHLGARAAKWLDKIVHPKGQKTITESTVRTAGLKAGLTDIKVVGFSATHTALKFVIPKAKR